MFGTAYNNVLSHILHLKGCEFDGVPVYRNK